MQMLNHHFKKIKFSLFLKTNIIFGFLFLCSSVVFWPQFLNAEEPEKVFSLVISKHKFNIETIEVKSTDKFQLKIKNADKSFEEFESKALNIEKFLKPNIEVIVFLGPLKPGEYDYFAEFHPALGKGKIIVKP